MDDTKKVGTYFFFAALIVTYILMYEPFCFVQFVPSFLRILIELTILLILLFLWISESRPGFIPTNLLIFPLLVFWLLNADAALDVNSTGEHQFPGFITKIAVLTFGINALQYRPLLVKYLARAWALLWVLVCIQVMLASAGYYAGLIDFPLVDSGVDIVAETYFNRAFGYATFRTFFGLTFAKFSSYLLEPLFFGLFTGLNILTAHYFLPKHLAKRFNIINLIGGLLSGSITFLLFFCSLAAYNFFGKHLSQRNKVIASLFLIITGALVSWIILMKLGVGETSSLGDRVLRLTIAINTLMNSTTHSLWFGKFNYNEIGDPAASNGLLSLLLQKGLLLFFPILLLFYKYAKSNILVLAYLFYYSLAVEYFWWPAFIIYLILFYCLAKEVPYPTTKKKTAGQLYPSVEPSL